MSELNKLLAALTYDIWHRQGGLQISSCDFKAFSTCIKNSIAEGNWPDALPEPTDDDLEEVYLLACNLEVEKAR